MKARTQTVAGPDFAVWLALVVLTAVGFGVGELGWGGVAAMAAVLSMAVVKAGMVAHFYMGLRRTRLLWRMIVGGYLLVVGVLIAGGYLLAGG